MPFENFYRQKETEFDQVIRRWWVMVLAIAAVFAGFVLMPDNSERKETHETPPSELTVYAERQRRADELCAGLPKPEGFDFVSKSTTFETYSEGVNYFYKTARSDEEIFPTFVIWFGANGWMDNKDRSKTLEFTKGNQTIMVARIANTERFNFVISCSEWKVE